MKTLFLCLTVLFLVLPSLAKTLSYRATGAGMHLLDADITYTEPSPAYTIRMTSQTRGLLSLLAGAYTEFKSVGSYQNGRWQITSSESKTTSGRRVKTRTLDFTDKPDTLDYPALFLDNLLQSEPGTRQYTVFDGRRTMTVLFSYQGKVQPETLDLPSGDPLDYYTVSVDVIAGKKRGWFFNRMEDKEDSPLHIYFQPMGEREPAALVYAAFDTALLGQIVIKLVGA